MCLSKDVGSLNDILVICRILWIVPVYSLNSVSQWVLFYMCKLTISFLCSGLPSVLQMHPFTLTHFGNAMKPMPCTIFSATSAIFLLQNMILWQSWRPVLLFNTLYLVAACLPGLREQCTLDVVELVYSSIQLSVS